ncbi:polysaccharide deacetylase family protein [Amycolatopsis sp. NPDC021455]|uniref:polysaccharide deacetylase family protein n=1 Tax=Amycolatopsis sp. NPDC021455 TaxID=3154901 RepID=UPI0033DFD657
MKTGSSVTLLMLTATLLSACTTGQPVPGTPAAAGPPPTPSHPHEIRTVAPTWIRGLRIVSDNSDSASCPWAVSYPAVPGADALTTALREKTENRVKTLRESQNGVQDAECPTDDAPELNVSFRFLAAAGDVVGVELTTVDRTAAGDGTSVATYWYDTRTRKSVSTSALIADAASGEFDAALTKALSSREGADPDTLKAALAPEYRTSTISNLAFTEGGDLVAEFDQGTVAVVPAGRQKVVIPKVQAEPLLSDFGRRAEQQALQPGNRLDLGGAPAPAPPTTNTAAPPPAGPAVDCLQVKCVALTFDDGPGPDTAKLLDTLARFDAHATFFVVGQNATYNADLIRKEAAAGHEIGNHSWNHPDLRQLSPDQIHDQIGRTDRAVTDAVGHPPTVIRPPYGAINDDVRAAADRPMILWSVDTLDWKFHDSAKVAQTVLDKTKPGDIVLLHDIHPTSVDAVPDILTGLKEQGYTFVTVSQLFGSSHLTPGKAYGDNDKAFGRS